MDSNKLSIKRQSTRIADPQSDLERSFCPFILAIGIAIIAPAVQWEGIISPNETGYPELDFEKLNCRVTPNTALFYQN